MLKLFSMKKKDGEEPSSSTSNPPKKSSPAQIRVMKDLSDLHLPNTCSTEFPDPDDLLNFKLVICPDEGYYKGGRFRFDFKIESNYPREPPKISCETKLYHPNIDLEGKICLNILREDWKPVLTINSIIHGLQYLFLEPNEDDPLNKEAANVLRSNRGLFASNVSKAMRGGYVGDVRFENCLKPEMKTHEAARTGIMASIRLQLILLFMFCPQPVYGQHDTKDASDYSLLEKVFMMVLVVLCGLCFEFLWLLFYLIFIWLDVRNQDGDADIEVDRQMRNDILELLLQTLLSWAGLEYFCYHCYEPCPTFLTWTSFVIICFVWSPHRLRWTTTGVLLFFYFPIIIFLVIVNIFTSGLNFLYYSPGLFTEFYPKFNFMKNPANIGLGFPIVNTPFIFQFMLAHLYVFVLIRFLVYFMIFFIGKIFANLRVNDPGPPA